MAAPAVSSESHGSTPPPSAPPTSEDFDQQVEQAKAEQAQGGGYRGQPVREDVNGVKPGAEQAGDEAPLDEAEFQQKMFEGFADEVDPEAQKRLSTWLPDALNGGKEDLQKAAQNLTAEQAEDLNALAKTLDIESKATEAPEEKGKGLLKGVAAAVVKKVNLEPLQQLQQAYGEHALKASTPQLAPIADYGVSPTIAASREAVYETFTEGLDQDAKARLDTWLPDAIESGKDFKDLSAADRRDLKALAEQKGYGDKTDDVIYRKLTNDFKRDVILETTGELPSVVDMMLTKDYGKFSGKVAATIDLDGRDAKTVLAGYEKSEFTALDSWLPDALAGRGEVPTDDAEAMALFERFAERMGVSGSATATPDKLIDSLSNSFAFRKSLREGSTRDETSFLLFSDTFLESTLKYGAQNGAVTQDMVLDTANVAEMLLGPDDGTGTPGKLDLAALQAALLHRTDEKLVRPQEMMAAAGYINKAETLAEQKSRLVESLLAFNVREKIGTPPMTAKDWVASYEEVHPEFIDHLGKYAWNAPTHEKMQIVTQHLGVPGDHSFMIDKKRKIKMYNDDAGNTTDIDYKKKKSKWYKKVLDVAVPVIGTVLTFVPGMQAVGMGINMAYSAYKSAQAIKHGDLLGGVLGMASAIPGGGVVARGAQIASGALTTYRAIESKDWLGALSGGLGTFGTAGGGRAFQTAATGVNTASAIKDGDYLQAGAGLAGLAGDAANYNNSSANTQFAFQGLEHGLNLADGIQERNYAGIGNSAAGLINTGHSYHGYRQEQARQEALRSQQLPPEQGVGGGPGARGIPAYDADGNPIILQAGYPAPDGTPAMQSIEVASGDTLSQIAERHGTTVDELMAANPDLVDPGRIQAGQQLSLPEGVQPVGTERQVRLAQFEEMNGGSPSHLPSPARPGEEPLMGGAGEDQLTPGANYDESKDRLQQALKDAHFRPGQPMDPRLTDDAMAVLQEDFSAFDTALQKNPALADGQVSRDDLFHVLRDNSASDAQRAAARVLIDNDFAFFRMASAGDDGQFNGLIDLEDLNRSFEGGQPRQVTADQYQQLATDFLDFKMQGVAADDLYGQNRAITEAYAQLYMSNPDFKWAGMAAFASDEVGTGILMSDLGNTSDWPIPGLNKMDFVPGADGAQLLSDLGFGNRAVFEDMYWQHMAYQDGGIQALEQMAANRTIEREQINAWRVLDQGVQAGDQEMVWAGNQALLRYEQERILQPMYERNREMWADLSGNGYGDLNVIRHLPYLRDWIGDGLDFPSAINGGLSFQDYMQNGDIGNFDHRMDWIENSMLPEWRNLEANPDAVFSDYLSRQILRNPATR